MLVSFAELLRGVIVSLLLALILLLALPGADAGSPTATDGGWTDVAPMAWKGGTSLRP